MSGLRCWPGCLAYITGGGFPENVGSVVEVIKLADPTEYVQGDSDEWECRPLSPIWGLGPWGPIRDGDLTAIWDKHLTPITPPPGTDCTTHEADKPQPVEA